VLLGDLQPDVLGATSEHRVPAVEAGDGGAFVFQPTATFAVEHVPLSELRPDPANPRRIDEAELDALTRSLRRFGLVQPLLARREDHTIIGGHQRLVAARRLGLATIPVIFLDLSADEARLLGLALNRIGGTFDEQLLARLLLELQAKPDVDLSLAGFGEAELHDLLRSLEARDKRERPERFDLDAALEAATREPHTRPGDLWELGDHRLLCGDATRAEDVTRLLDGRRAELGLLDPPYNAAYRGGHGPTAKQRRPIANDALDGAAFEAFLRAWVPGLLAAVDGALYVFMSSKELPLLSRVLAEGGGHWSDTLIWAKGAFTLGRAPYQRAYEPIWFGWREGAPHYWCGVRDQSDVWEIPKPDVSPLHPTQKPLALLERAIEHSSRPGDLVLDIFAGAGSTLIAAERTGRVAYTMELDARYCDVIAARWAAFTGGEPHLAPADGAAGATDGGAR
jgi:DNA modification methylase